MRQEEEARTLFALLVLEVLLHQQADLKWFWRLLASSEPGEMADVAHHHGQIVSTFLA